MKGYSDVLIGTQFGDEGKARIIDNIANEYDIIARFNGGPNAGHTLEVGDKRIALHQIPSGIFHPNMLLYVGSGCVLNLKKLSAEKKEIESFGVDLANRFFISDQATIILPHHIYLDKQTGKDIGTTANGIGPAYADRALRADGKLLKNLRLGDLLDDPQTVRQTILENYAKIANIDEIIKAETEEILAVAAELSPHVSRNPLWLDNLVRGGKKVLFEGAQASMLDVVKGTVPYVTSSHTVAGSAYVGGDLSLQHHRKTIGVAKAVMSRVGNGPFVSEFGRVKSEEYCAADGGKKHPKEYEQTKYNVEELLKSSSLFDVGIALRMIGNEYGATTKRPRRIGMLDLVALRQNCRINGVDELYINKLDCLVDFSRTNLPGIPLVAAYELNGQKIDYVPGTSKANRDALPVIEYFQMIKQDLTEFKEYNLLPLEAKELVKIIEEYVGCKVAGVGVGPKREQFITQ